MSVSPYLRSVLRSFAQVAEARQRLNRAEDAIRIERAAKAILAKTKADLVALGVELNRTTGFEVPDLSGLIDGHIHDLMSDSFSWARSDFESAICGIGE